MGRGRGTIFIVVGAILIVTGVFVGPYPGTPDEEASQEYDDDEDYHHDDVRVLPSTRYCERNALPCHVAVTCGKLRSITLL